MAAATAAFDWQAAFIAPVHWAEPAGQPAAGAACTPLAEATTAFVVVVDPALAVFVVLLASHAWAHVAVQAHAKKASASSRIDFMDPTSRKV